MVNGHIGGTGLLQPRRHTSICDQKLEQAMKIQVVMVLCNSFHSSTDICAVTNREIRLSFLY